MISILIYACVALVVIVYYLTREHMNARPIGYYKHGEAGRINPSILYDTNLVVDTEYPQFK